MTYVPIKALKYLSMWQFFMLSSLPADPNVMCLDIVMRNGIPSTSMISTDSVMFLYCCMMETGIDVFSTLIFGDTCLAVFSSTYPRSGPQMNSVFLISYMVIG